jgi:hypothetical protein
MALATKVLEETLKAKILETLNKPIKETMSDAEVKQRFAGDIAKAIADGVDTWIKTGTVTVSPGIPVSTSGTPVAQTGATTGPGTGTIS